LTLIIDLPKHSKIQSSALHRALYQSITFNNGLGEIIYEKDTDKFIAKVTINRPEVRNAFRPETLLELLEAWRGWRTISVPMRDDYRRNLQAHLDALRQVCGLNHVDFTLLRTSQPLDYALHAYLAARSGKL